MQSDFAGAVRTFVVNNFLLGRTEILDNNDSFIEKGIIDSTGILELVSFLEETYSIEVAEDELIPDNLDSINRIVNYLSRKAMTAEASVTVTGPELQSAL